MALFQNAPRTPEEADNFKPLDIAPDQVLEMSEEEWYEKVYRGDDVPQLTIRATLMGSVLGFLLAFTNLYVGLKTGWALGVAITACILSYSIWNLFLRIGVAKSPMTILENNCMQSTASAAGYSTGGTMVSAIAALLILSATPDNPEGEHMDVVVLICWTVFLAVFGTVLAIPMKRTLINKERLKFPSGTAAATTLQSLYSEGAQAIKKARALAIAAISGAIFPILI
ncbi:MAG: OPT/YSL family transporter, partial [Planctomycetota bacterium]|nr:OPT/YSL family transporter [Planctomycetota bacterium]